METITIKMYGHDVEIPRGNMKDDEWNDLKARAEEEKRKLAELSAKLPPPTDEIPPPSDATSRAGRDLTTLAEKAKKGKLTNEEKKELVFQLGDIGIKADPAQIRPIGEAPEETPPRGFHPRREGAIPPELPEPQDQSAGGSRGLKKFVEQGLKGATSIDEMPDRRGAQTGQRVDMGGGLYEQPKQALPFNPSSSPDAGTAPQALPFNPQASRMQPDAGVIPPSAGTPDAGALQPQALPQVPPWLDTRSPKQVFQDMGQTVGAMVGPSASPAASPLPRSPVGPPPTTVTPAGGPPGGASAGLGVKVRGQTQPGSGIPEYPPKGLQNEQRAALEERAAALGEAAEINSAGLRRVADAEADYARRLQDNQAELLARQEAGQARAEQIFKSTQEAQKILMDPAKTPDPERYWKNHSKVLFAIGVGLLAANKRDIGAVLNNVQTAIKNDIDAQIAEFEAPRKAAKDTIAANNQLYGMLRSMGHDEFEAQKMAQTLMSQQVQMQIRSIADANDSELVKANARDAIARLQQDDQQRAMEVAQHAKALGIQEYNAKTQRWEVNVRANAAASKGGGRLTVKQQNAITEIKQYSKSLMDQLQKAKEMIQREGTFEATGKHKEIQNMLYNGIAIDSAKLADPDSVARESEVKIARDAFGLEPNQLSMRNQTAVDVINEWQKDVVRRAKTGLMARLSKAGEPLPEDEVNEIMQQMGIAPGAGIQMGPPR